MDDNQTYEADYLKGFNEGYIMAELAPELTEKLVEAMGDSTRSLAFKHGREQFIQEKEQEMLPDWLRSDRSQDRNIDSYDKDREDLDRE